MTGVFSSVSDERLATFVAHGPGPGRKNTMSFAPMAQLIYRANSAILISCG